MAVSRRDSYDSVAVWRFRLGILLFRGRVVVSCRDSFDFVVSSLYTLFVFLLVFAVICGSAA